MNDNRDTTDTREKIRQFVKANCVVFEDEAEFSDQDNFFDFGMVNSLFAITNHFKISKNQKKRRR
jgi:hypothetical protein